jgi:hypothetical protein
MYRYVSDVSEIAHYIIKNFSCKFDAAIDATLGNGYDTDFLSEYFSKVYSFDIQECAIKAYESKNKKNVVLINDSHENFHKYVNEKVDCVIYNLGFLPGGDKNVTTKWQSTIISLKNSLKLIDKGALIAIALYKGHEEGKKEESKVMDFVQNLPKEKYGVMLHSFINRSSNAPFLIIIEKK